MIAVAYHGGKDIRQRSCQFEHNNYDGHCDPHDTTAPHPQSELIQSSDRLALT